MPRPDLQMTSQGTSAAYDSRLSAAKTTGFDRGEVLRQARVTVPFALGFLALAASIAGPAEMRGPLLDASAIVFFLLGLSAASHTSTVSRSR